MTKNGMTPAAVSTASGGTTMRGTTRPLSAEARASSPAASAWKSSTGAPAFDFRTNGPASVSMRSTTPMQPPLSGLRERIATGRPSRRPSAPSTTSGGIMGAGVPVAGQEGEQFARRPRHDVEHLDESLGAAVVGIRNVGTGLLGVELAEQPDLVVVVRRGLTAQVPQVRRIHREDPVVFVEVVLAHLACAAGEPDAAHCGGLAHPRVGRLADVPSARAGRIDDEDVAQSGLLCKVAEDAFGSRRPADISKTDEQDTGNHPLDSVAPRRRLASAA